MEKFTVVGCNEVTGQVCCIHVLAKDATNAFASAAALDSTLSMVVAQPGWLSEDNELTFAGDGLVDADTVLEQTDVFGEPAYRMIADDIESVLQAYSLRVTNTQGKSFEMMAAELVDDIDQKRVVQVAMGADAPMSPAQAAFDEIKNILVERGVLEF